MTESAEDDKDDACAAAAFFWAAAASKGTISALKAPTMRMSDISFVT